MTNPDPGQITAGDPGLMFTTAAVNVDGQLGDYSADRAVADARAALRGEQPWTPFLTAPAILTAALTAELADIREQLDDLRDAAT
jgi:hypothetical protein